MCSLMLAGILCVTCPELQIAFDLSELGLERARTGEEAAATGERAPPMMYRHSTLLDTHWYISFSFGVS